MIYVDGKNSNRQPKQGYVMIADSKAEFIAVEKKFGVKLLVTPRDNARFITFYITGDQRKMALELGAVEITQEQLAEMYIGRRSARKEKYAKTREEKLKRENGE